MLNVQQGGKKIWVCLRKHMDRIVYHSFCLEKLIINLGRQELFAGSIP